MKLLTKDTDYAIRALLELAGAGSERVDSRAIADRQEIPYQFLRRIMQRLKRAGLVESKEGAGGGFKLAADPGSVTVTDVMRIFQGEIRLSDCLFRKQLCSKRETCVLRKEIKRIESIVESEFSGITIESLIERLDGEAD